MLLVVSFIPLIIWLYLLFARGGFWHVSAHLQAAGVSGFEEKRVVVVIPARDEADVIGRTISSLLQQSPLAPSRIIVVDDASSDGTARIAQETAAAAGQADVVTTLEGKPLEPGWSGKLWALSQGTAAARALKPDYLLLTDADITHAPDSLARLVATAEHGRYDLTSFMVKLQCSTLAEKALIPPFVFFFLKLYPPAWIRSAQHGAAGAAGGCILIRPAALESIGGIEAIRSEVIDDCALAAAVKKRGGRVCLGLTPDTASTRSYESFSEIGRMISRTAFNQLRHSTVLLLGAMLGLVFTYLLPPVLVFSGSLVPSLAGGAAWLAMTIAYWPIVRFYGLPPFWALSLPLAALFYMCATLWSAVEYWRGRGGRWKGRVQDVRR